jgi:hypothetical protein
MFYLVAGGSCFFSAAGLVFFFTAFFSAEVVAF